MLMTGYVEINGTRYRVKLLTKKYGFKVKRIPGVILKSETLYSSESEHISFDPALIKALIAGEWVEC